MVKEAMGLMYYELIAYFAMPCGLRSSRGLLPLSSFLRLPGGGKDENWQVVWVMAV
jgi:hypothetical protein